MDGSLLDDVVKRVAPQSAPVETEHASETGGYPVRSKPW